MGRLSPSILEGEIFVCLMRTSIQFRSWEINKSVASEKIVSRATHQRLNDVIDIENRLHVWIHIEDPKLWSDL
jgi:hypothetical protein